MTNKEVHITHCISLESSNNSHSFGDMLNDSKYINKEKDIDNLYIEDTQHKYDQNILTFINKRKRGRYPNSLNSHSCSKLISFLQFQQEAPSTKKIPLKVANSERIEFIDGKITMNQLNISNKNSESDLLVEDEGNLFSREFEFDYKAKDQLKICGYYGGIEGKKFYYNEKEFDVGISENKNENESAIEKIGKDISKISGEEGENGKSAMVYEEEEEQGKNDKEKELLDLVRRNEEEDERELNQKNGNEDVNKEKENEIVKENNDINNDNNGNENVKEEEVKGDERENEEINKIQEIHEDNNDNINKQEDDVKKEDNIDNKQENDVNKDENIDNKQEEDVNKDENIDNKQENDVNKDENIDEQKDDDVNKKINIDKQKDDVNKEENVENQNDDAHKEDNTEKQIEDVHKEENIDKQRDDVNKNQNINNTQKDVVNEDDNGDKSKEDAHKDENVNKLKDDSNKEENVNKLKDDINQEENISKQEDNYQNTENLIDNNINPTEKLSEIINDPDNNNKDIKENIINNNNKNVEIIDINKNLENKESKTIENNKSLIVPPQENLDKNNELNHIKEETYNNNNNNANNQQNEEIIKQENNKTEPKENIPPNQNENNKEQQQNIQPTKDITNNNPQQIKHNISNDKQQTIPPNNEIINNNNPQQLKPKTSNNIKELPKIQINNTSNIQQPSLNTSNIYQPKQQITDRPIIPLEDRLKWNGDELEEQQQSINKSKRNSLNALKKHPKNKSISSNNSDSIVLSPFIPSTNKPSQINGLYNHNTVKRNSQKIKLTSKPRNEIIKQQLNDSFQSNSNNTQHQHQKLNNNNSISHDKEYTNNDNKYNYQPHQLKPLGSNDSFQNPTPTISSNMSRLAEIKKYHVFNKTKNFFFADCNQQQQIKLKPKSGFMYPNKLLKSNRTLSGGKILMSGITEKHFQRYIDYYKTLMQDKSNPYSVYWNEKFFNKHKDNHEQIIYHDINSYAPTVLKRRLVLNGNADTSNKRRNSVSPQYELIEKTYLGNNYKKQTNAKTNNGITHQNGINVIKYNSSDNTSINNDSNRNDKKKMQTIDNVKYPSIYKYFH